MSFDEVLKHSKCNEDDNSDFSEDNSRLDYTDIEIDSLNFIKSKDIFYESLSDIISTHEKLYSPLYSNYLNINREDIIKTSYDSIMNLDVESFKYKKLSIVFRDELGIDEGGLKKEWFKLIFKHFLDEKAGFFKLDDLKCNAFPVKSNIEFKYYHFFGRLMGRLLIDKINVNIYLHDIVFKQILDIKCDENDFEKADDVFFNSLKTINKDPDECNLLFVDENDEEIEEGGINKKVTKYNVDDYIKKLLQHKYINSIKKQIDYIKIGFYEIIDKKLLSTWTSEEFKLLLCGRGYISVEDWKINTKYRDFSEYDLTIKWFWEILEKFTEKQKSKLLQFATGTSRVPVGGFSEISNTINNSIFNIVNRGGMYGLPTGHTCSNSLELSPYNSKEKLRDDLLYSINYDSQNFYIY